MNRLTKEQAVVVSAYTGILAGDVMADMHKYIEKIMGRPVWTHELANKDVQKEIQEKSYDDFISICYSQGSV